MAQSGSNSDHNSQEDRHTFSAFISYSHADAAKVRKLHSQLEAYRLPKGLGSIGTQNSHNGRLGKVFRDREDLSAAQDLSAAVTDALDRTQVLVVACSPAAKASHWVNQEVLYFRDRHPDRPILAAILAGDPEEAFPPALLEGGAEPLAADLRKEGDGWRLGFLKTVAGIADKPLDALVQRDSQRQLHRVIAVTCAVGLLAIVMGVMTMIALQARDEAQALRKNSDAFVERQLTEGRRDLKAVGRGEILQKFNERTLEFYEEQRKIGTLPDDSLEIWARLLHAIGEDYEQTGDFEDARKAFAEAHDVTAELLRREPQNKDRIFAHAQSEFWVGDAAYSNHQWNEAEDSWLSYKTLALKLHLREPDNVLWTTEAGYGEGNICTLELMRDDKAERDLELAYSACSASLQYFEKAAAMEPKDPGHKINIANRHAWIADIYDLQSLNQKALDQRYIGEGVINDLLKAEPKNFDWLDLWVAAQTSIISAEGKLGLSQAASARRAKASSVLDMMLNHDPENSQWKSYSKLLEETQ
ncbi:MAG: toll/interleukin-1 receptor domain-containing protein [Pseudomonadota bacterium]